MRAHIIHCFSTLVVQAKDHFKRAWNDDLIFSRGAGQPA
jgi:hypothetical protein